MDTFFQNFCNKYPIYLFNTKFKKKIFYIFFSLIQFFLKGPFLIKFKLFSIFVYPDKNDYTRYILTRVSLPDISERKLIINNLTNHKNIFIDCGANSGFYSLDVSTLVKNVEIYAFEPSDKEFMFLKKNIEINKHNFKISPTGLAHIWIPRSAISLLRSKRSIGQSGFWAAGDSCTCDGDIHYD